MSEQISVSQQIIERLQAKLAQAEAERDELLLNIEQSEPQFKQLIRERDALKAEVGRLTVNLKSLEERFNIGFQNFTREREISAILRERLESARGWVVTHAMQTYSRVANQEVEQIDEALAREKEMRK